MPNLDDPLFSKTVVYIFEHTRETTSGLIINKVMPDICVHNVLERLDLMPNKLCDELLQPVYYGGPVNEEHGYLFHTPKDDYFASISLNDDLAITFSKDVLDTIGSDEQPKNIFFALGYANWAPMQLEDEIINNDWLVVPGDQSFIFDVPAHKRWHAAAQSIGIDLDKISLKMGHA